MSDSKGIVRCDVQGAIATITFERPAARNALTWEMYGQLAAALDRVEVDSALRVAVLRGHGHTFVAGTDIAQFTAFRTADDGVAYEQRLESIVSRLERISVPTIAAIEGHAAGAGLILAAACDLRICTPDARFAMPIARTVGNCLAVANHARLIAAFGEARTRAMILTAAPISADEAYRCGFVLDVVPHDRLSDRTAELCGRIIANAPVTMAVTKEAIRRIALARLPDGDDLLRHAYGSRDFHEGVAAFLARRTPQWTGT